MGDTIKLTTGRVNNGGIRTGIVHARGSLSVGIVTFNSVFAVLLVLLFFFFSIVRKGMLRDVMTVLLMTNVTFLFAAMTTGTVTVINAGPMSKVALVALVLTSMMVITIKLGNTANVITTLIVNNIIYATLSVTNKFVASLGVNC